MLSAKNDARPTFSMPSGTLTWYALHTLLLRCRASESRANERHERNETILLQTVRMFTEAIVKQVTLKKRVNMILKIIVVAELLYKMNNFTGLVAVMAALNHSIVMRLKSSWEVRTRDIWW